MPYHPLLLQGCTIAILAFVLAYVANATASKAEISVDQPNPIALQHPTLVSGTLNGTTLIVPIPLDTARAVIPKNCAILEHVYRRLLPSFPQGMYPLVATAVHDHDIQFPVYNLSIPDFSRAALEFPFLDIFGDNSSSFRWSGTALITASNSAAVEGAAGYGISVHPAGFDPPSDAYRATRDGGTYLHAKTTTRQTGDIAMTFRTRPSFNKIPYPMDFIRTITNQPTFANTTICDKYVRLYNTSLTASPFEPVPVMGSVSAKVEPFSGETHNWGDIYGWRFATAFLEPPVPQPCETLKGSVEATV